MVYKRFKSVFTRPEIIVQNRIKTKKIIYCNKVKAFGTN